MHIHMPPAVLLLRATLLAAAALGSGAAHMHAHGAAAAPTAPSRQDVLTLARQRLASNGASLATRRPQRAAHDSTFGRFLVGDTRAPSCRTSADAPGGLIDPRTFGADATGRQDSSDAFDKAVAEMLSRNTSAHTMGGGITDLGGATIDLMGGDYKLSRPIVVPHGYGNFRIAHGTVRAGPGFPTATGEPGRYLVEISDLSVEGCKAIDKKQKSCNENVGIEDVFFDCGRRAWGGLQINATMGANIGPDVYFLNFLHAGLTLHGGHESMLHEAWLGATYYGTKNHTQSELGSVAIEILGNDHIISDVIIFGGQVGVYCDGGANLIEGVHTWNDGTHAASPGFGIVVSETQSVRILAVYLDYTALRLVDPAHISVVDSFFLGGGTIVVASGSKQKVDGLMILDNTWENFNMPHNVTVVVDERSTSFSGPPVDMVMTGNVGSSSMRALAVTITKSLRSSTPITQWNFNFTNEFAFPSPIVDVQYSIQIDQDAEGGGGAAFARHASRKPVGQTVMVETDVAVSGTVTLTATQGTFTAGNR